MSGAPPPPSPAPSSPQIAPQQTRRGLRPINTRIQSSSSRIEGLTPLPPGHAQQAKRPRQTRWQFGIRSRNSPLEAVGCIYRALRKLGAEWELEECDDDEDGGKDDGDDSDSDSGGETPGDEYANSDTDSSSSHEAEGGEADNQDTDNDWHSQHNRHNHSHSQQSNNKNMRTQTVPTDPWIIHCRWRKSSHTSTAKRTSYPPTNPLGEEGLYVHMEIQLYQLEHNFYLVDFKCAGYERLGKRKKVGFLTELGGDGQGVIKGDDGKEEEVAVKRKGKGKGKGGNGGEGDGGDVEKEVSSPFPFLELASRLIIQLAEATE